VLEGIKTWDADFYLSKANQTAEGLQQMASLASADFQAIHPECADEVADILAWCYTYDFK